ncbi:MAG: asparaginase, partial [Halomonas sp.]|nr:asparaginase [Halomonas sp.]
MSSPSPLSEPPPSENRILVIYTGGTIGMQPQAHGLAPSGNFATRMGTAFNQLPLAQQQALPPY